MEHRSHLTILLVAWYVLTQTTPPLLNCAFFVSPCCHGKTVYSECQKASFIYKTLVIFPCTAFIEEYSSVTYTVCLDFPTTPCVFFSSTKQHTYQIQKEKEKMNVCTTHFQKIESSKIYLKVSHHLIQWSVDNVVQIIKAPKSKFVICDYGLNINVFSFLLSYYGFVLLRQLNFIPILH